MKEKLQKQPLEEKLEVYSPVQLSRIATFSNILEIADHCEETLREGKTWGCFYQSENKKQPPEVILEGDWRFVYTMRNTAFNMYLGFQEDPALLEAAEQIIHYRRMEKEMKALDEQNTLNQLWNA